VYRAGVAAGSGRAAAAVVGKLPALSMLVYGAALPSRKAAVAGQ